jgi:hypothetical protein
MGYGLSFFFAAVTLIMAVTCGGFALLLIGLGGSGAVAPGLIFAAFSGGLAVWGWHALRILRRPTEDRPAASSLPEAVEGVLTIRKTSVPALIPMALFGVIGWSGVVLSVASALGLVAYDGSAVAGMVIGGLFALFGHVALMEHAVTVRLDLRHRRWGVQKGVWPIRSRAHGELTGASHVAVAREVRWDEGEYEVLVARLEWRDGRHAPLILGERPNDVDGLRYGGDVLKLDYRRVMIRWASALAAVLNLPLTDQAEDARGAEC